MAPASENPEPGAPDHPRRQFLSTAMAVSAVLTAATSLPGTEPMPSTPANQNPRLFSFVGSDVGTWKVTSQRTIVGEALPSVARVEVVAGDVAAAESGWVLRGATSHERYVTRSEKNELLRKQVALGRAEATSGAILPIRKNDKWWALTQEERRAIFEETSHHIAIGMKYLPAVARRLHHCRDLSRVEPFDFITLFDFAPADSSAFDDMLTSLRATEEWKYIDREIDIRLERQQS
ncbi:hypothetical protein Psta_0876 [Pirellula staleyi DSM 6068]|uniref:Chlorite dismutase n=1 Tax=Pirellula staleyi (strain ATCC 27377 / DSM 6068 / ICPB 4128) TaxID=530564 RepID=D2R6I3_PIRSD|nr:chlorite dismutase family protein [Pirellula staleyi]ADB15561.1 hypothetical protein Psta_0876 [Pirellula staleyi DSM 6068]